MKIIKGIGLSYMLAMSVAVAAHDPAPKSKADAKDPNAKRCRSAPVTGSLVRGKKVCRTNAEWEQLAETGNRDAQDMMRLRSCAGPTCGAN